jgi:hypothetical protein
MDETTSVRTVKETTMSKRKILPAIALRATNSFRRSVLVEAGPDTGAVIGEFRI